ncbi:Quino protein alcohol dehydrogenase-like protein [Lepidopterella palustris CBS 459.81]|uniref:Quino protein alcohol dehydrogenase-like protein n=1 Tax=Lepidopterella palustris CBS 459.81 TaxID=1314670 RepID=A0A8E2JBJ9_9PEZI|nr:Quino protein alcohol dehydrogenase-like protein [Lepidopterella palustris CBS 459.81]
MKLLSAFPLFLNLPLAISTQFARDYFQESQDWSGWGGGIFNNRWAPRDNTVSSSSIHSLSEHCQLIYPLGVSATPTIHGNVVYYPTWSGLFVALNYVTCTVQWEVNVTDIITGFAPLTATQTAVTIPVSRTSPQVDGDVLYFATQTHALLIAVNRLSGKILGMIQINEHPLAISTTSPTVYNGTVFVGASSAEESAADLVPGYQCCSFIGNMAAFKFDDHTGSFHLVWNLNTLPEPRGVGGWSGGAVWGGQPSIDKTRSQVFFATGNIYSAPPVVQACQNSTKNESACLPADVWQESVLAIDLHSGHPNWVHQLTPLDSWTLACGIPGIFSRNQALCPGTPGPDADFGMAPAFVPEKATTEGSGKDVVVIGQKNGNLYSLSAETGTLMWSTVTSPDGTGGGLSWGIAVDDSRVYFTAINSIQVPWQLQPSNRTVQKSAYGAASLANGSLLWETETPKNSSAYSPPTVANDIVVVGRTGNVSLAASPPGTYGGLVVLEKTTGKVISEFDVDTILYGGIAVQDQYVLFGTGYSRNTGTGSFYVMSVTERQGRLLFS